jgi:hypothetical protein
MTEVCVHVCMVVFMHVCKHSYTHTSINNTYKSVNRSYLYVIIHTYIHTYIHTGAWEREQKFTEETARLRRLYEQSMSVKSAHREQGEPELNSVRNSDSATSSSRGGPADRNCAKISDCALRTEDLAGDLGTEDLAGEFMKDLAGDVGFGGKCLREAKLMAEKDAALSKIWYACMCVCVCAYVVECMAEEDCALSKIRYVCMHVCMCVCVCVCVCVRMCLNVWLKKILL